MSSSGPVAPSGDGFVIRLDGDERALLVRLLAELRELLTDESDDASPLLERLFPPAFHDDPAKEAEYQRLMRDELVASRMASIELVSDLLDGDHTAVLSEGDTMAFMQSVNAIRLVLGTMLGITDDDSAEHADGEDSPEHHLYAYLGWLLDWTVRALSGNSWLPGDTR